jgi:phage terminase small subunit
MSFGCQCDRDIKGAFSLKKSTAPPSHLSPDAKDWFFLIQQEYGIEDSGGVSILTAAAEAWDRCTSAREAIEADGGPIIKDRFSQLKPHPACAIERDSRAQFLAAIKSLNLDLEPVRQQPGRPTVPTSWSGVTSGDSTIKGAN